MTVASRWWQRIGVGGGLVLAALVCLAEAPPLLAARGLQSFVVTLADDSILDVRPVHNDVAVTDTRWVALDDACWIMVMRSYDVTLKNTTVDEVAGARPCHVTQKRIDRAVSRSRRDYIIASDGGSPMGFDSVLATCDGRERRLVFDYGEDYLKRRRELEPATLQRVDSAVYEVWQMGHRLAGRVRSQAPSIDVQEAQGTLAAEQLRRGRYARAYADKCYDNLHGVRAVCNPPYWQQLLGDYTGPPEQRHRLPPVVLERDQLPLSRFVQPQVLPIAQSARIFGDVRMRLTVAPDTGAVSHAEILKGHAMLNAAATDIAMQWQFLPGSIPGNQVDVTISYRDECPNHLLK